MRYYLTMKTVFYFTLISFGLYGCASKLPQTIAEAPVESISAGQVQQKPDAFAGKQVRWGGEILEVGNSERYTDVLVVGRELEKDGQPIEGSQVDARFIARFPGFREPSDFPEGKLLTVSGTLSGVEVRNVGEYPYTYPVVSVLEYHRWPEKKVYDRYPYYYPPYYGWGRYPGHSWWGYPGYPYWW